jgi:hypothetical protein
MGLCSDCGYGWDKPIEDVIEIVRAAPDLFTSVLSSRSWPPPSEPHEWSATGYLWHLVDILRFGTERLWTIVLAAGTRMPGWDQEVMAANRHYEQLSVAVGLKALQAAASEWVRAANATPMDGSIEHPSLGTLSTEISIRRNAHEVVHHARDAALWIEAHAGEGDSRSMELGQSKIASGADHVRPVGG